MTATEQHTHLNEALATIRPEAADRIAEATERQLTLTKPPGSLSSAGVSRRSV